jgi:hypothetical protein
MLVPKTVLRVLWFLERYLKVTIELVNTVLPEKEYIYFRRFWKLRNVPRMSTFAFGSIINRIVSNLQPGTSYVNIGVWNGFTFLSGSIGNPDKICIGVDNFSQFGGPKKDFLKRFNYFKSSVHSFYDMDYQEYFKQKHEGKIGCYFYDEITATKINCRD